MSGAIIRPSKEVSKLSRKSEDCVKLTEESYYGTRMQAIRKKCIDCCGGDRNEVKRCHIKNCPLWVFRLAKKVTKEDCDEQKEYIAKVGDQLWQ